MSGPDKETDVPQVDIEVPYKDIPTESPDIHDGGFYGSFQGATAAPDQHSRETSWSKYLATGAISEQHRGEPEYRTFAGPRVDILTDSHAVEVEWISKWAEAIGQCLYYSAVTQKKPMIILLAKKEKLDKLYYSHVMVVANKYDIVVDVINTHK